MSAHIYRGKSDVPWEIQTLLPLWFLNLPISPLVLECCLAMHATPYRCRYWSLKGNYTLQMIEFSKTLVPTGERELCMSRTQLPNLSLEHNPKQWFQPPVLANVFLHLQTWGHKSLCPYTVAPASIFNSRVPWAHRHANPSVKLFLGNPFLLSSSPLKIQQFVFISLIPFTKTLSNEFENHFLLYMSVLSNSGVISLTQTWLDYDFFSKWRSKMAIPRPCKCRRKVPHREKQKLKLVGLFWVITTVWYCSVY